jgi:molybdenum cofactor cytidylyltransferase
MVSCILLSAGLSSRFGSPKALARIAPQETLIEHIQRTLLNTQLDEIIVVIGAQADKIESYVLKHKKVKFVYNKDYNFGQTSSVQVGLNAVSMESQGMMILPVDYPLIQSQTIEKLIDYFNENKPLILIPTYHKKKGHPPIFHCQLKKHILNLDHAAGLNTISHQHKDKVIFLSVDDSGVIQTFNTQEELTQIISRNS